MVTGDDPGSLEIDHKNRIGSDNRWLNLRLATRSDNCKNRRPRGNVHADGREVGVNLLKDKQGKILRYQVKFCYEGKYLCFGAFLTLEEANEVALRERAILRASRVVT